MKCYTIGIDTGGTFTDAFVADGEGRHWAVKVPTTPHDLTVCFADAIARCAEAVGIGLPLLLRHSDVIRFSSTIGTNTILTRSGPKLGLIVTRGEEAALYGAAEGGRIFEFLSPAMVRGIDEAVAASGDVVRAVDSRQVDEAVRELLELGARLIVVSLRNATINPSNERAVGRAIDGGYPRHYLGAVPTLLSTQVSAVAADASRTASAVVNAYTHKQLSRSLYKAEDDLRASGFRHPLLVVTGDGAVTRVSKTRALSTYQSGPAAGVHASAFLATESGLTSAITADVGGTSTDIGLVAGGRPLTAQRIAVGGLEVARPSVEVFSIALGGGSIARVEGSEVAVGPMSAGSVPGPASFGLGGREPTPTDAWLLLGYLSPGFYLGGRRRLRPELAERAVRERIAEPLGRSVEEAALALAAAAEAAAAHGIEAVLDRPGVAAALNGSRRPALVAYGGGGGILLPPVAAALGIERTLLSVHAPVFSAFGVSNLDVRHRYEARLDGQAFEETVDLLVVEATRDLRGEGFEPAEAKLSVQLLGAGEVLVDEVHPSELREKIAALNLGEDSAAVISLSATCEVNKPGLPQAAGAGVAAAAREERDVLTPGGRVKVPVYDGDALLPGQRLRGPALLETERTTSFVPEQMTAEIDKFKTAVLRRQDS